jgi:glutamine amidotransferase
MGWNSIKKNKENPLFKNIENDEYFYFCHSYYFKCKRNEDIITQTSFGSNFASSINNKNIYGIQFHPEKSHDSGSTILKNFAIL